MVVVEADDVVHSLYRAGTKTPDGSGTRIWGREVIPRQSITQGAFSLTTAAKKFDQTSANTSLSVRPHVTHRIFDAETSLYEMREGNRSRSERSAGLESGTLDFLRPSDAPTQALRV